MPTMKLTDLHVTPLLQVREGGLNTEAVADYTAAARRGDIFPPLVAYQITDRKFPKPALVAGFHRHQAFTQAGMTECEVDLRTGTFAEAWLCAWTSNLKNAVRYTNADKRKATETALKLYRSDSAPVIADRIAVSDEHVRKVRKGLVAAGVLEAEEKVKGKDGREQAATKQPNKPAPPVPTVGTCATAGAQQSEENIPRPAPVVPAKKTKASREDVVISPPVVGAAAVGVYYANAAINVLKRIPMDDPQRGMAGTFLSDWIGKSMSDGAPAPEAEWSEFFAKLAAVQEFTGRITKKSIPSDTPQWQLQKLLEEAARKLISTAARLRRSP